MKDIKCVCKSCKKTFLWTHEERIAAVKSFEPSKAMFDTRQFKIETGRMKKPDMCGGCRTEKKQ